MFKQLFKYIELNLHPKTTIFVHNLGSFDGYFIFKYASNIYNIKSVKSIIDNQNKFILIEVKKIKFVDSHRIFAISLNALCDVFNHGEGKTSAYNSEFNSLNMFKNPELLNKFRIYADNDSIVLYKCMLKASILYQENYDVDISQVVSMSSLSMLIFRKKFLNVKIPVLNHKLDEFIRDSYYGGATDYYIKYAKKVYYYDVNSLYPFAMLKDLPLKPPLPQPESGQRIKWIDDSIKLSDFFGFALVKVYCPVNISKPLLPKKHKGKTIFPTGTWIGIYYSEELKAVEKYGYKVEIIKGLEFSKAKIFTDYINHFYEIKKTSTGPLRFIGKNNLNYLYGLFGRLKTVLETITILNTEIEFYLVSRIIKNIIKIDDEKSVLLTMQNIDTDIVSELNSTLETELLNYESIVKTNVAIASAVTANARIHMIPFKISNETCYTDTDSVFTTLELPNNLIGEDLGMMKDELKGLVIEEAYFFDIKKYGYWYIDQQGQRVYKSTVAGVKRNSLSWSDLECLASGGSLTKVLPKVFYKNINNLSIEIKDINTTISNNPSKKCINNRYIPIDVFEVDHKFAMLTLTNKLKYRIKHWIV